MQGATTNPHTILTEATSAASVYVGMTRGRESNLLHVVADNLVDAREQFVAAMQRDRAGVVLPTPAGARRRKSQDSSQTAPSKLVNNEITALMKKAATAEAQAERWQQVSTALADLRAREMEARETTRAAEKIARRQADQARVEAATPLVAAAQSAFAEWHQAEPQSRRQESRYGQHRGSAGGAPATSTTEPRPEPTMRASSCRTSGANCRG